MIRDPYIGMPIIIDTDSENSCGCGCGGNTGGGNTGGSNPGGGSGDMPGGDMPGTMPGGTFENMYLGDLPLAMCYVPMQQWNTTYPLDKGLERGTIFPELDLPFKGGAAR